MIKKPLVLLVSISIIFLNAFPFIALADVAITWQTVTKFPQYDEICKIAPYEDGVWLAADDQIYRYDFESEALIEYQSYSDIRRVAAISKELVIQTPSGLFWLGIGGEERLHIPMPEKMEIDQIERCGENLVVLGHDESMHDHEQGEATELLLLSNEDGSVVKKMTVPVYADRVATDDQGMIYLPASDGYGDQFFLAVDIMNEATRHLVSLNYDAEYIAASAGGRWLYFLMDNYVYTFDTERESIRSTGIEAKGLTGIRRGGNALFSGDYEDNMLMMLDVPEIEPPQRQLKVVNPASPTSALEALYRRFEQKYPEVEIKASYMGAEQIIASFMAGGDDIDILFWDTEQAPSFEALASSGCLLDLNLFPELVSAYEGFISMEGLLTYRGQWVAVPNIVWPRAFFVNEALASSLGIDIPAGQWDFERLIEMAIEVDKKSGGSAYVLEEYTPLPYLEEFLFTNCVDPSERTVSYDQEVCRRALEIWMECIDKRYICQSIDTMNVQEVNGFDSYPNALLVSTIDYFNRSGDARVIEPPVAGDMRGIPSYMQCMMANGQSQNQDIIIDFLALYASDEVQAGSAYSLCEVFLADASKYPEPMLFGRVDEEAKVKLSSPRNQEVWITLLKNAARRQVGRNIARWDSYDALMAKEISVMEYLQRMQMSAEMAVGE